MLPREDLPWWFHEQSFRWQPCPFRHPRAWRRGGWRIWQWGRASSLFSQCTPSLFLPSVWQQPRPKIQINWYTFFSSQFKTKFYVFIIVGCEEIDIIIIVSCSSCGGSGRSGGNFGAGEFAGLGTERLDVVVPAQGMSVRAGGGSSQSGKRGYIGLRWSITLEKNNKKMNVK